MRLSVERNRNADVDAGDVKVTVATANLDSPRLSRNKANKDTRQAIDREERPAASANAKSQSGKRVSVGATEYRDGEHRSSLKTSEIIDMANNMAAYA